MRSMTGYGRSKLVTNNREYIIEIKSVNNRYADVSVKMPRTIAYLEEKVKSVVLKNVTRGKVEVYISFYNYSDEGKNVTINKELAKTYLNELKQFSKETELSTSTLTIMDIIKMPDVLNVINEEDDEIIWTELSNCLNDAIVNFVDMKEQEGININKDIKIRLDNLTKSLYEVIENSNGLVEKYIEKLKNRIEKILPDNTVDENRIAQETIIYADKSSIEEEITRLKSHINQFENLIKENSIVGKKLDFLLQEMNREINTIGSKANSLNITNSVINLKTELENIREQIQNIE